MKSAWVLGVSSLVVALGCAGRPATPADPPDEPERGAPLTPPAAASPPAPSSGPAAPDPVPPLVAPPAPSAPVPQLPAGVVVGEHAFLPVPGDQGVHVYHAPAEVRRALVYLHGVCGDVHAIRSWVQRAVEVATVIELVADSPCANRPGRASWKAPVARIIDRIDAALAVVREARGGLLDTDGVVLFGYSQGAARAQALAHLAPARFSRVVLGSPPKAPDPELLAGCRSVVVLGGTEEHTAYLEAGTAALREDDIRARYVPLPGARHGEFGAQAPEVIADALAWLLAE